MLNSAMQLWRDEGGVSTVEYALLLAFLVAMGAAAYEKIGPVMSDSVAQTTGSVPTERVDLW